LNISETKFFHNILNISLCSQSILQTYRDYRQTRIIAQPAPPVAGDVFYPQWQKLLNIVDDGRGWRGLKWNFWREATDGDTRA